MKKTGTVLKELILLKVTLYDNKCFLFHLEFCQFCHNIVYEEQDKLKVGRRGRDNRRGKRKAGSKKGGIEGCGY